MDNAGKEFVKRFATLTVSKSAWQVWAEIVEIFAIMISNSVDLRRFEEREKRFKQLGEGYSVEQQQTIAELFAFTVEALEKNPDQDFLGQLFMELQMGSHWKGQFFTPYHVCEMMARMEVDTDTARRQVDEHGYCRIADPACGAGATLIAAANRLMDMGINYQQHALFVGQDIDQNAALMCYIQLSLLGCPGMVRIGDTLREPKTGDALYDDGHPNTWITPMWYADVWQDRRMIGVVTKKC